MTPMTDQDAEENNHKIIKGQAKYQNTTGEPPRLAGNVRPRNREQSVALPHQSSHFANMIPLDRIVTDPHLMNGQPCLRSLRLTVRRVVEIAATYPDSQERAREYPELEDEDIRQALHYAALHLPDQIVSLEDHALVA